MPTHVRRAHWYEGDVVALGNVVVLLVMVRMALTLRPFPAVRKWVLSRASRGTQPLVDGALDDDRALRRAVQRGARLLPGTTCLPQALAGLLFASSRGLRAWVCIGVQAGSDEPFGAHAWLVTARGVVIGGEEAARFTPLLLIEPAGPARSAGIER